MFSFDTCAFATVTESGPDAIDVRYIACAEKSDGLQWTMSRDDAKDLARWWNTEDVRVKSGQRSVRDKDCGNVLVSMFTSSVVHVRVRDRFGNVKVVGYSFPLAVLEQLKRWFSEHETDAEAMPNPGLPDGL